MVVVCFSIECACKVLFPGWKRTMLSDGVPQKVKRTSGGDFLLSAVPSPLADPMLCVCLVFRGDRQVGEKVAKSTGGNYPNATAIVDCIKFGLSSSKQVHIVLVDRCRSLGVTQRPFFLFVRTARLAVSGCFINSSSCLCYEELK